MGAGQGVQNVVGIFVGTGIGGGIILQGELFHGASKTAGEIGHIIVKAGGPRCGCGTRGCLEAIASRTAMTKKFQKAILKKGKKSVISELTGGDLGAIRSGVLAKAIRLNDKLTLKVFKKVTKYLGIGIGSIVNFLNPEMIILGGGVVEALDDTFLDDIRAADGKIRAAQYAKRGSNCAGKTRGQRPVSLARLPWHDSDPKRRSETERRPHRFISPGRVDLC